MVVVGVHVDRVVGDVFARVLEQLYPVMFEGYITAEHCGHALLIVATCTGTFAHEVRVSVTSWSAKAMWLTRHVEKMWHGECGYAGFR